MPPCQPRARRILNFALLVSLAAVGTLRGLPAQAADYPERALRLVVPFAPGGSTDVLARIVGQKLSESVGQPVIIDNRPAAGGTVGSDLVAKAAPDGYTLLIGSIATMVIAKAMYAMIAVSTALSQVASGKIRALGVTSARPTASLPGVPSISAALPGYDALNFHGLHAPPKTPRAIVARLNDETNRILRSAEVVKQLGTLAMDVDAGTPAQYREFIRKQLDQWLPVVTASGARAD